MTLMPWSNLGVFEANLKPNDPVQARWTDRGRELVARAVVVRLNDKSVRLRLTEAAGEGYPRGTEVTVPKFPRLFSAGAWSVNNGVFPLSAEAMPKRNDDDWQTRWDG